MGELRTFFGLLLLLPGACSLWVRSLGLPSTLQRRLDNSPHTCRLLRDQPTASC